MIRFVEIDSQQIINHVPSTNKPNIFYDMYLDDKCIGQTIGRSYKLLVVNLFGRGHRSFDVDVLEQNLDKKMTIEELIALGQSVG